MKNIILFALLLIFTRITFSQDDLVVIYRGYGMINYIGTEVYPNDIMTDDEVERIVNSIGIKTLPDNIYFSEKSFKAHHTQEEFWETFSQPYIDVIIHVKSHSNDQTKYWGKIEVSLIGHGSSNSIEMRLSDYNIDKTDMPLETKERMKNKWSKTSAKYEILSESMIITHYEKNRIKSITRELIQEIFDELNILIRDYP